MERGKVQSQIFQVGEIVQLCVDLEGRSNKFSLINNTEKLIN